MGTEDGLDGDDTPPGGAKAGRLKIFLGMSAGVGKTYAMLREAQAMVRRGRRVLVAWLEPHGRAETDAQAEGLERLPAVEVEYRGVALREMDLEAALRAKPDLALVDELAHSNAPGLRHPKRWQDVFDLLDAGVDVYTTVNIQHLESVADAVEDMSGAAVRERVPDAVFDRADNIQMVDISPGELRTRLGEGKVYTGAATGQAVAHFFRTENLTALRELALRQAAKTAGHQLSHLLQGGASPTDSLSPQRLLVAVSPSPNSEHLLRWTRRLAYDLKADWTCLYVETGQPMGKVDQERLVMHLTLARNLGAQVVSMINDDVAAAILGFARHKRCGVLVVGKSGLGRRTLRPSITDRLIRESGQITVMAVQERANPDGAPRRLRRALDAGRFRHYLAALGIVALTTAANALLAPRLGYQAVSIVYLAVVSVAGLALGRGAVALAALLSALAWDFLFIPPHYTLYIGKTEDIATLCLFCVLAVTSGWATGRLKSSARLTELRERRMEYLSDMAQAMSEAEGVAEVARLGLDRLGRAFGSEACMVLADERGNLRVDEVLGFPALFDDKDKAALEFCIRSGHATGRFTATLPAVAYHFLPMAAPGGSIGVIGLRCAQLAALTEDQHDFLRTLCRTIAMAVGRERLALENRRNILHRESERLGSLLLHSISHELRTPLTVIKGGASALTDPEAGADPALRAQLLEGVLAGCASLNDIIENILSINRLENGLVRLDRGPADPADLVETARGQCAALLAGRRVDIGACPPGAVVDCDEALAVQVLRNLLQNFARHTPPGAALAVAFSVADGMVRFDFSDDGPGVAPDDLPQLFDKFWRGPQAGNGGTGLGLAICKGLVELHGGAVDAAPAPGGGLRVGFTLPVAGAKP